MEGRFKMVTNAKQFQVGTAAIALAAAVSLTPVLANANPALPQAPSLAPVASVLTFGYDQLDSAILAQENNDKTAAVPGASAVPTPGELLQYLVQGIGTGISDITRGVVVIGGTAVYVTVAFTGGLITTVGNFLPGPIGDFFVNVGTGVENVANTIAEALRVGPYATFA